MLGQKMTKMPFVFMTFAATVAVSCLEPELAYAWSRNFILVNNTPEDVVNLWSSPDNSGNWGRPFSGVNVAPGERQRMAFSDGGDYESGTCWMDIRIEFRDGSTAHWDNIDLCKTDTFTVYIDQDGSLAASARNAQ
jgi:hypothetical protein